MAGVCTFSSDGASAPGHHLKTHSLSVGEDVATLARFCGTKDLRGKQHCATCEARESAQVMSGERGPELRRESASESYAHAALKPTEPSRGPQLISTGRAMTCVRTRQIPYSAKCVLRFARDEKQATK